MGWEVHIMKKEEGDQYRIFSNGCNEYLTGPITKKELCVYFAIHLLDKALEDSLPDDITFRLGLSNKEESIDESIESILERSQDKWVEESLNNPERIFSNDKWAKEAKNNSNLSDGRKKNYEKLHELKKGLLEILTKEFNKD